MELERTDLENSLTLPVGVLTSHVFAFVRVETLKKCACVCREWKAAVDEDVLWKPACARLWRNKRNVPNVKEFEDEPQYLYPYAIYPPQVHLSIKEMKQILVYRGFSVENFLERTEFERAIEISQPRSLSGWKPAITTSKWKCAYVGSVLRAISNGITKWELLHLKWSTEFNFNGLRFESRFLEDGTTWNSFENNGMPRHRWVFIDKTDGSQFDYPGIRVEDYPPLMVSRTEDWGYIISNTHVNLYQDSFVS